MSEQDFLNDVETLIRQIDEADTDNLTELIKIAGVDFKQDLAGTNLSESDLTGADLSGGNFARANLSESNLTGADLSGGNFARANLSESDLTGADLSGGNFARANLSESNLTGADLSGSNFAEANLRGADLNGSTINATNFNGANLIGTVFEQSLNLIGESQRSSDSNAASERQELGNETKQKQLLLIDDDPGLILLIKDYLEFRGYQVITASNGREALSKLAEEPLPDMIICDAVMPEMDGYALIEQVRQDPGKSWIPIIMLSSQGQSSDRVKGLTSGADVYMVKPFEPDELVNQVESSFKQATRLIHHQNKGPNSIPTIQVPFDVELTPIELKVVQFVARGMANRQIAEELKVSQQLVAKHVSNLLGRTGLHNRTELARWAFENDKA